MAHKLVDESKDAFTVQHPDGSTFKVAKHGLSKALMQKIKGIEPIKMADGGDVPEPAPDPGLQNLQQRAEYEQAQNPGLSLGDAMAKVAMRDAPAPPEVPLQPGERFADRNARIEAEPSYEDKLAMTKAAAMAPERGPAAVPGVPASAEQAASQQAGIPQAAAAAAPPVGVPYGPRPPTPLEQVSQGFEQQRSAVNQQAAAAAQQARASDLAYKNYEQNLAKTKEWYDTRYKALDEEGNKFKADLAKDVDPNRYWNNKSTGQKIGTAIGIMLGAVGQGLSKSNTNAVMDMVNKQVEQDIESQKADLGKKQNLLSMNLQKYGNLQQAMAATQLQYNQVLQAQVARAGAQSGSAAAQAAAQALTGQLQSAEGQYKQGLIGAQAKALQDMQGRAVPQLGVGMYAPNNEAANKVNERLGDANSAVSGIKGLMELMNTPGASTDNQMRARANTIASMLQGPLRGPVLGPGTVNDTERALLESIVANPTNIFSLSSTNRAKLQTLLEQVTNNTNGYLKAYGLPEKFGTGGFRVSAPVGG